MAARSSPFRSSTQHRVESGELVLVEHVADDVEPFTSMGHEELVALRSMASEALGELGHLAGGEIEAAPQVLQSPTRPPPATATSVAALRVARAAVI